MTTYNGWPNKGTWSVSLYCESLEDVYAAKEYLEDIAADLPLMANDLLTWAIALVEWHHLEQAFSPAEGDEGDEDDEDDESED